MTLKKQEFFQTRFLFHIHPDFKNEKAILYKGLNLNSTCSNHLFFDSEKGIWQTRPKSCSFS